MPPGLEAIRNPQIFIADELDCRREIGNFCYNDAAWCKARRGERLFRSADAFAQRRRAGAKYRNLPHAASDSG